MIHHRTRGSENLEQNKTVRPRPIVVVISRRLGVTTSQIALAPVSESLPAYAVTRQTSQQNVLCAEVSARRSKTVDFGEYTVLSWMYLRALIRVRTSESETPIFFIHINNLVKRSDGRRV